MDCSCFDNTDPPWPKVSTVVRFDEKGNFIAKYIDMKTQEKGLILLRFPPPRTDQEEWINEYVRNQVVLVLAHPYHEEGKVYVKTDYTPGRNRGISFQELKEYTTKFVCLNRVLRYTEDEWKDFLANGKEIR